MSFTFLGVNDVYDLIYCSLNKDVRPKFFLGFSVYISNSTKKEDGVLCFRDTNFTRATIPNPVNITCPYHGRYVIYYNNRTHPPYPERYSEYAWIALCEVQVYGKKSDLFWSYSDYACNESFNMCDLWTVIWRSTVQLFHVFTQVNKRRVFK